MARSRFASSMNGLFSASVITFHSAPSRLLISELCILGFSCAIFLRWPRDQTMKAFMGLLIRSWGTFPPAPPPIPPACPPGLDGLVWGTRGECKSVSIMMLYIHLVLVGQLFSVKYTDTFSLARAQLNLRKKRMCSIPPERRGVYGRLVDISGWHFVYRISSLVDATRLSRSKPD
ncbi:hypothetical protein EYF80_032955 [Liparis tanakae]|uniref:Uncharacterized protein n=1 Tax=Liparis tanakae TaxID=230148 RepID=A0A4Z2GTV9_9TELE|nr:hypothetical protein EYF80_032955 [Liparis tanakae]